MISSIYHSPKPNIPSLPSSPSLPSLPPIPHITYASSHHHPTPRRGRRKDSLVDHSMIILRKRIHEIKTDSDSDSGHQPPPHWMAWEKDIYNNYDSIICDAMGHLQTYLMDTRPSFLLGILALIALSLPTSTALLTFNFLQFAKALLSSPPAPV